MNTRTTVMLSTVMFAGFLGACAAASHPPSPAHEPRPGQSSFFNAGTELIFGLDVRAARLDGVQEILPVQVVVLNRGKAELGMEREAFTLVRPDGVRIPVASTEEIWRDSRSTKTDLRLGTPFLENVFGRYPEPPFHWSSLDLFPDKFSGTVPRDSLRLRFGEGAFGYLYFRHPAGGVPPLGKYTLLMRPSGSGPTYVLDFFPYDAKARSK